MNCMTCGKPECGTLATPMHYLFRETDGRRDDIRGFCSTECLLGYVDSHEKDTATVPRCVVCGRIIVNAPWYANLSDQRPRHQQCTQGADDN